MSNIAIYKNPYVATSLKQKFMRDDRKYAQVFSSTTDLKVWVTIATLIKMTDHFLSEIRPHVGKNTIKFLKNYRQIVIFITVSRLLGTFAFGEKQLAEFDLSQYTKEEVEKSLSDLTETDPNCFSNAKKLSPIFYTTCFKHIASKYAIDAIQAIQAQNQKLWSGNAMLCHHSLSDEIVEKVLLELPEQPWPVRIHQQVAQKLGVKDIVVSNAISYLIYTGKVHAQVFGYVFDSEDNIVAEGEHFGHTEKEARENLKEQRSFQERKFGF